MSRSDKSSRLLLVSCPLLCSDPARKVQVHVGALLSGNWLVDNEVIRNELVNMVSAKGREGMIGNGVRIFGGEMEAVGFRQASVGDETEAPVPCFVVKGVSDFADGEKNSSSGTTIGDGGGGSSPAPASASDPDRHRKVALSRQRRATWAACSFLHHWVSSCPLPSAMVPDPRSAPRRDPEPKEVDPTHPLFSAAVGYLLASRVEDVVAEQVSEVAAAAKAAATEKKRAAKAAYDEVVEAASREQTEVVLAASRGHVPPTLLDQRHLTEGLPGVLGATPCLLHDELLLKLEADPVSTSKMYLERLQDGDLFAGTSVVNVHVGRSRGVKSSLAVTTKTPKYQLTETKVKAFYGKDIEAAQALLTFCRQPEVCILWPLLRSAALPCAA
jgi:hypothetical protein